MAYSITCPERNVNDIVKIKSAIESIAIKNGAMFALLFGSYARGTATRHSDVDVIFVEETSDPFIKRLGRYMDPLVDELHLAAEVFVYTPREFSAMKAGFFVKKALDEGVIVYELGKNG